MASKDQSVMKLLSPVTIAIALVVFFMFVFGGFYNSFVTQANVIDGQWKQVEVSYQRRFDLIPNLVESVRGLQKQEQKIFGDVSEARTRYAGAQTQEDKVKAANELEGSISRLLAIFENYPQIKSDQAVLKLQDELAGTENRIAVERRRYNDMVKDYNTSVSVVPGSFFASFMGFKSKLYFESTPGSESAPKVQF